MRLIKTVVAHTKHDTSETPTINQEPKTTKQLKTQKNYVISTNTQKHMQQQNNQTATQTQKSKCLAQLNIDDVQPLLPTNCFSTHDVLLAP